MADFIDDAVENGVHNYSEEKDYVWPTDKDVLEKLEWFMDNKLALMMHWGAYCQIGVVESWALSDDDGDWSRTEIDWVKDGEQFKREYFDLNKTFNPIRFQPDKWAKAAKEAGFKYYILTTKHHDGFCMWDTKYTDYKITGSESPYKNNENANVVKKIFDAMRKEGLGITAYFSKADWHCPDYWNDGFERGTKTWRGPSYRPDEHPEIWQRFEDFTWNQVNELCDDYGPIDALWFDAGWVCKESGQDIHLGEHIEKIRAKHPGILSVDRTIGGPYENYVTPEQCVPEKPLNIPWESCITMGTSFSFKYEDNYKSPREVIALLCDIVCKGGNLALNVGPQPDGRIPAGALKTMEGMGKWLSKYGDAIFATRVCAPYKKDGVCFTVKKDKSRVFAIKCYENEEASKEEKVWIPYTGEFSKVTDMYDNTEVNVEKAEGGFYVRVNSLEEAAIAKVFEIQ